MKFIQSGLARLQMIVRKNKKLEKKRDILILSRFNFALLGEFLGSIVNVVVSPLKSEKTRRMDKW